MTKKWDGKHAFLINSVSQANLAASVITIKYWTIEIIINSWQLIQQQEIMLVANNSG